MPRQLIEGGVHVQVNSAPFTDGWMLKVKLTDPSQVDSLMDASAYEKHCDEDAH